jgi:hypothetical protein
LILSGQHGSKGHQLRAPSGDPPRQSQPVLAAVTPGSDGVEEVSRDFYIRQIWDDKGSALNDLMSHRC